MNCWRSIVSSSSASNSRSCAGSSTASTTSRTRALYRAAAANCAIANAAKTIALTPVPAVAHHASVFAVPATRSASTKRIVVPRRVTGVFDQRRSRSACTATRNSSPMTATRSRRSRLAASSRRASCRARTTSGEAANSSQRASASSPACVLVVARSSYRLPRPNRSRSTANGWDSTGDASTLASTSWPSRPRPIHW